MEDRLSRIEDKLDAEIQASATFRGRLEQYIKGQTEYTDAVSAKATAVAAECDRKTADVRRSLDDHKVDAGAHGAGIRRDMDKRLMSWAAVAATALAAFGGVIEHGVEKLFRHAP